MKKLKLDLAEIQVSSFTVDTAKGGGTVNAHNPDPGDMYDVVNGTTTLNVSHCNSCPFCLDEPIGPAGPAGP